MSSALTNKKDDFVPTLFTIDRHSMSSTGVVTLTINNPKTKNALSKDMISEVRDRIINTFY
jgi:enoyl-CoA hydratase/carnithine racemase